MKPILVEISKGSDQQYPFEYRRFQGRTLTNHVRAVLPMCAAEVDQFRVRPESMLDPEAA